MKILIVGAGAIGGVTAAYMAKGGVDVTLVCKRQSTAETIRKTGLRITGIRGEHIVKLKAVADFSELDDKYDYCLIATKAYDLEETAKRSLPYLEPEGLVLSLQNGICIDMLVKAIGNGKSAGAVVTWSCTMCGDALFEITGEGEFIVGMADGSSDNRLTELKQAMDYMAPTSITNNILCHM